MHDGYVQQGTNRRAHQRQESIRKLDEVKLRAKGEARHNRWQKGRDAGSLLVRHAA